MQHVSQVEFVGEVATMKAVAGKQTIELTNNEYRLLQLVKQLQQAADAHKRPQTAVLVLNPKSPPIAMNTSSVNLCKFDTL